MDGVGGGVAAGAGEGGAHGDGVGGRAAAWKTRGLESLRVSVSAVGCNMKRTLAKVGGGRIMGMKEAASPGGGGGGGVDGAIP